MNQWDERYDKAEYHYGTAPNDFLRAHAEPSLSALSATESSCTRRGRVQVLFRVVGGQRRVIAG